MGPSSSWQLLPRSSSATSNRTCSTSTRSTTRTTASPVELLGWLILVRECARRILDLSKEKEKLKLERREAKKLRNKIVGAGNTMDSYGDKFVSMRGSIGVNNKIRTNYSNSVETAREVIPEFESFSAKTFKHKSRLQSERKRKGQLRPVPEEKKLFGENLRGHGKQTREELGPVGQKQLRAKVQAKAEGTRAAGRRRLFKLKARGHS